MSTVDVLRNYLNRVFPGSDWKDSTTALILENYDSDKFARIVEQMFPLDLWLVFTIIPHKRMVVYKTKYDKLKEFITHEPEYQEEKSIPVSYMDITRLLESPILYEFLAAVNIRKLTSQGLIVGHLRINKLHELFSNEMLLFIQINNDVLSIPLENIKIVLDYLTQLFPIYHPTPEFVKVKFRNYLNELISKIGLDIGIYTHKLRGTQHDINILNNALPVPLKLVSIGGEYYNMLNEIEIYEILWDTAITDNFRRQLTMDVIDSVTIKELKNIIGDYIVQENPQFWERELFDISRREYLKEILDLPPELTGIISSYI